MWNGEVELILEQMAAPPGVKITTSEQPNLLDSASGSLVSREMVQLLVKNAELEAKLNATEKWTSVALEHAKAIAVLEKEKAKLEAEVATYRAQIDLVERYTNALVERAELAAKLESAQEWISNRTAMEIAAGAPSPFTKSRYVRCHSLLQ